MSASRTGDRPDYVPKGFAGKCKVFPPDDTLLIGYQRRWVLDKSLLKIMEKARRVGVSYATAYERVRNHADETTTLDSWVSSRDEPTARLFVRDCKLFSSILKAGADDMGMQVVDEKGSTAHVLSFANATRINSVASNPDVFAGKGGDVFLDEFALRADPRGVYAISSPTIDWGGRLAIVSTHRGSANYFNELIGDIVHKGNPMGFSHHKVTLESALAEGLLYKLQTKFRAGDPRLDMDEADYWNYQRARSADEETFLQEYCCVPGDDASAFLSYDLIAACEYPAGERWELTLKQLSELQSPLFLGGDIGRDHDLTVFWLTAKAGDVHFTRHLIELKATPFAEQEARLYDLLSLPNLRRCCIDETGIGRQLVERAQQRFGKYKVEGVTFTGPVKEELAYPVRAAFEDRSVRIPNDANIRADLRAVKKETTASGNIRFTADRGKNGHADRFWALALALHAGKNPTAEFGYTPIPRERREPGRNRRTVL